MSHHLALPACTILALILLSGCASNNVAQTGVTIPPGATSYVVQKGDSLSSVANSYNISPRELVIANRLGTNPLKIGQMLLIPNASETMFTQNSQTPSTTPVQEETRVANIATRPTEPAQIAVRSDTPETQPSTTTTGQKHDILNNELEIPTYNALIIGINDYQNWQDLKEARTDAEAIEKVLKEQYSFTKIKTLYDKEASLVKIDAALRNLVKELQPKDALLIYYSGHGYYDRLLKKGYWIPSEAREQIEGQPATVDWINNTTLKENIAAIKAKHVLVISDSCFSGSLFRGTTVDLASKENSWYRRAISQPSRWAISSGDLETVPDESIFARKVKDSLLFPKRDIFSSSDLAGWLKSEVAAATGNQPLFGPMADPGHSQQGEFVFIRKDSAGALTNAPSATK